MAESSPPSVAVNGKTEFGIPIDPRFGRPATEAQLERTAVGLRERGFVVEVVDSPAAARELVSQRLRRIRAS
ncbi:MAG: hypothetical protein L3K17_09545 [Thermoplasmata archaeon]|nr:hypothetical protein [Thermoplasmata archaeon]